ncbi:MAG: hypothetical protein PVG59_20910, partial [Desulfobacterales bacterium]
YRRSFSLDLGNSPLNWKGQPAITDVDQPAGDSVTLAENVKHRIANAVTGELPLLCFHENPFPSSGFCRDIVHKRQQATRVPVWFHHLENS